MKKKYPLHFCVLISLFIGFIVGAGVMFVSQQMIDAMRVPVSNQLTVASSSDPSLSAFQLHYVNQGGRFARIPLNYCSPHSSDASMTPDCGVSQGFVEIDVKTDPLPVDKIQSAVTNGNGTIVYAVDSGKVFSNGCPVPDLYHYNLQTHETKQLRNDPSLWSCGASNSILSSLSAGARYAFLETSGASSGKKRWVYDLQKEQLDLELTRARNLTIFSLGEDTVLEDRYSLYIDACPDQDDACKLEPMIKIRNNQTSKAVRMTSVETLLKKKGMDLRTLSAMKYSLQEGALTVWGDGAGSKVVIPDFRTQVLKAVN